MKKEKWSEITVPQTGEQAFYGLPNKEPFIPIEDGYGFYGVLLQNYAGEDGDKVQCHIDGQWVGSLSQHAVKKHGYISANDYKGDFGFGITAALIPEKLRIKQIKQGEENYKRHKLIPWPRNGRKSSPNERKGRESIEFRNKHNTCEAQLLTRLKAICQKAGTENITYSDVQKFDVNLAGRLQHYFGTFNNVKTFLDLPINPNTHQISWNKDAVIEAMKQFYKRHNRKPTYSDFRRGTLLCTNSAMVKLFGTVNNALMEAGLRFNNERAAIINIPTSEIITEYKNGATGTQLATKYRCSPNAIYSRLKKNGVKIRQCTPGYQLRSYLPEYIIPLPIDEIISAYKLGASLHSLSKKYNCSIGAIKLRLGKNSVSLRTIQQAIALRDNRRK